MNPTRSLGPTIVASRYRGIWVYMVGPITGAIGGAWVYNIIRFTNKPLRVPLSLDPHPTLDLLVLLYKENYSTWLCSLIYRGSEVQLA